MHKMLATENTAFILHRSYMHTEYFPTSCGRFSFWSTTPSGRCNFPDIMQEKLSQRPDVKQRRIQPISLRVAISVTFGSQVSLRVHYC